jgi:hypothetical protein
MYSLFDKKSGVDFNSTSFFKTAGFNVYCLVVSGIACSCLNFLPAAAYYWHCGRIECMVLSTAAVSCGSQSVLSTMGAYQYITYQISYNFEFLGSLVFTAQKNNNQEKGFYHYFRQ